MNQDDVEKIVQAMNDFRHFNFDIFRHNLAARSNTAIYKMDQNGQKDSEGQKGSST